jgi:phage tail-like protein
LALPTALAVDREGRLYVVEEGKAAIAILDIDGHVIDRSESIEALTGRFPAPAIAVDDDGTIWISDRVSGLVCRVRRDCSGRCIAPEHAPRVPAHCALLAFDRDGNAILGDPRSPCVFRTDSTRYEAAGFYLSEALDSGLLGCVWDRIAIDAELPFGTRLVVQTTASDIEFTTAEVDALTDDQWVSTPLEHHDHGHWHCAVRSAPGRFLWLRLSFGSDGIATPAIASIAISWPRITSMRYLPAVFAEEPLSSDFLARFIEIFDQVRAEVLAPLDRLPSYFDAYATPAAPARTAGSDFLDWLGSWIGLALDRNWSAERRRRLVAEAPKLFRLRGTILGMKRHVAVYTGVEPRIVEHFRLRRWLVVDEGQLGDNAALWGPEIIRRLQLDAYSQIGKFRLVDGGDPLTDPFDAFAHRCTLYVPVGDGFCDTDLASLEAIVELCKPAHVEADIRLMRPRFVVGCETVLGVNTVLGRFTRPARNDESVLGEDIRLSAPPPVFSLRPGLRLGHDTTLQ